MLGIRRLFRVALLGLHLPSPAGAQSQRLPLPEADGRRSVAIVISGGASLGAYEAGYIYALGEVLKRQGDTLRVATGASAGSGNALFAALNSCTPTNNFPTRDPGYRFWLDQRFDRVFQRDSSTAISAFIATPGLADLRGLLEEIWHDRLPASCDVSLGIAVTKLVPLDVALKGPLTVPRQLLYFTIRIHGRGDSLPPVIQNTVDSASRVARLLLPLSVDPDADGAARGDRDRLIQVIAASGAFPFAFPPVKVAYCSYPKVRAAACHNTADTSSDLFIDGGVFDNIPLGLASTLSRSHAQTLFVYLDPDLRAYPVPAPSPGPSLPTLFDHAAAMTQGFVRHARKTELFALLADRSAALDTGRLFIASSRFPQASGFLGNFFGLFEREIRRFDFYLGMYDALEDLGSWSQFPSSRGLDELAALMSTPEWQPLRCLREAYGSTAAPRRSSCDGDSLHHFRILAQIAVNRVYSQCRNLKLERSTGQRDSTARYHCRRAAQDSLPPTIALATPPLDSTRVLRDTTMRETELEYNLRLLAAYGFQFRDLHVPPGQPNRARRILARRIREVIETLAARQPTSAQRKVVRLGTLAVAAIYYESPPSWWYVVMGTAQEIGISRAVPVLPAWLRLNAAFRVEGIVSLLTQDPNQFALGAFVGPEFELRPFTNAAHTITVAPRVGYQLSQGDHFHSTPCGAALTHGDGRDCSQAVLQVVTSFIAVERVRLQVSLDYFPHNVDFDNRSYNVQVALGAQF
jgi:predicted acylesterase/phospholipase RssA